MMDRPLPPLSTLQAFCAIAETGGFGRAAERLGLTQTAVSHQIAQLEGWMGGRLFERGRHGARLSALGLRLHPEIASALASLESALHQARQASASPSLTIATTPEFSSQWLAPRVEAFCRRYPKIEVRTAVGYQRPDFSSVDLAIWLGHGGVDLVTEPLLLDEEFVVCAPTLSCTLPSRGAIRAAPLLLYRGMRHTVLDWQRWYEQVAVRDDPNVEPLAGFDIATAVEEAPVFGSFEEMLQACSRGQGFALVRSSLVAEHISAGKLVRCFVERQPAALNYAMLYPPGALKKSSLALFRKWLVSETERG
ncbi:LysR family glycine cleavage system transcriptional activator [Rhizobium azibense]|uniref:LysR family glycine cleavage system transcriptional activator n=1 Tax=Rhizobium azibense TaxID=1136135 RepID=A0A4R3RL35_9HYPH|nr:LysR substrate-binding domain-containing protein [Rhizobium azibense]TCU22423.1 LysR family glycine cleavage system transcriptional activator [Rhizobium azibense]TCU35524.1 LysR family glycine cleavage system transcriptional activator [Rhizobium azibense]